MRFSVWPSPYRPFEETAGTVALCERLGWHAAYVADHFMPNGPDATPLRGDVLEALATPSGIASRTSKIRLGTLVAAATYRHPAVFSKAMATLDQISGGRAIAGIGAGWQENEHASYGIELGTITQRVDRFTEYVAIVDSMLTEETTTFEGTYFSLHDAPCDPRPVQSPLPILLGVRGKRRTMAIAAKHAEVWNAWCSPTSLAECNQVLDAHCDAIGRDPKTLSRSTQALVYLSRDESWLEPHRAASPDNPPIVGTPEEVVDIVAAYRDAGCDELIVPCFTLGDAERCRDTLELFSQEVAQHFSD
ncbi:MAG TPA: LLM class flavin-dependent oxidoreductase [Acidimicrobiales bacterium]|jgi:alkanesulfonate monooxygenase SsuD/methylene tetrahydromethanopterin reductase-like flavin-dependent oxidoreductase (luciferase family)|nr:LLM class flavin-dependent oxidoreductase [Acidimicrobiales bacterium]